MPDCPARQRVVVESTDQVDFSIVRGLSANGDWLVTSRAAGSSLELTLRRVGANEPGEVVGTITDRAVFDSYPVAISDDGDTVVFDGQRWDRASGSVSPLPPPVPGAVLQRRSPDGRAALWRSPGQSEPWVIDSLTDQSLGWADISNRGPNQGTSRSGRFDAGTDAIVDLADGSSRSFASALASIGTEWGATAQSVSNNGRFVLLQELQFRQNGALEAVRGQWWTYDLDADVLVPVANYGFDGLNVEVWGEVANDGRVVFAGNSGFLPGFDQLTGIEPDGSENRFQQGAVMQYLSALQESLFVTSEDLRSVAYTTFPSQLPPTARVVVARCI